MSLLIPKPTRKRLSFNLLAALFHRSGFSGRNQKMVSSSPTGLLPIINKLTYKTVITLPWRSILVQPFPCSSPDTECCSGWFAHGYRLHLRSFCSLTTIVIIPMPATTTPNDGGNHLIYLASIAKLYSVLLCIQKHKARYTGKYVSITPKVV
jgi:hypothetical protein